MLISRYNCIVTKWRYDFLDTNHKFSKIFYTGIPVITILLLLLMYNRGYIIQKITSNTFTKYEQLNHTRIFFNNHFIQWPHHFQKCDKNFRHFVFIRTHKTGSTTIKTVTNKIIQKRNLLTVRDCGRKCFRAAPFIGGYPGHIDFRFIPNVSLEAITEHSRFNSSELKRKMPKDTKYFTILREPWSHFQSSYNYYGGRIDTSSIKINCHFMPVEYIRRERSMEAKEFMHECNKFLNKTVPWYFRFKNSQAHDLGFDPMLSDDDEIRRNINIFESEIDLVLINEYMDESMILLKSFLCADWDDMTYVNSKGRLYEKFNLSENERKIFKDFNKVDVQLYKHFNTTFWKNVENYGRDKMASDISKLKELRNNFAIPIQPSNNSNSSKQNEIKLGRLSTKYEVASRLQLEDKKKAIEIAGYMTTNSGGCYEKIILH